MTPAHRAPRILPPRRKRAGARVARLAVASIALWLSACDRPDEPAGNGSRDTASPSAPPEAASSAAGGTLTEVAPNGRLPGNARPTRYALALTVDPRKARFSGSVTIATELMQALDGLWLHGNGLDVAEVRVTDTAGKSHTARYRQILPTGVSRVSFPRTLGPGEVTLHFEYSAPFDDNLAGLFAVEERGDHYALAKSESIKARKFLPGFDEPGYKAPFDIELTVPRGYGAVSNAPVIERTPAADGMERVRFDTTRALPTYLLSLAVGPFDVVERPAIPPNDVRDRPIPLRGVARKGRGEELDYILDITPAFIRILERSLQVPYPYSKLDIVAAPQWPSGATELAAAVTYREQRILAQGAPSPGLRRDLIQVHAHELAHMWLGNLVTPPWWDDLWLKEGFATWGTPLVLTQWEPGGGHRVDAVARAVAAMRTDSLASARAVREPIADNADIRNAYTAIPYSKGMAVIAMADNFFGAESFRPALGEYVQQYADRSASSEQFFETIGNATGEPALTEAFRSFVEQSGVPSLSVTLDCGGDDAPAELRVRQQRYRPLGSPIEGERDWVIPFCAAYAAGTGRERACKLLRERATTVPLKAASCPGWVHPNAHGAGYYRWNLSPDDWARLTEHFGALTPGEALTAVDSAIAAFEAGEAEADTLLAAVEVAAEASNRNVTTAPLSALARYERHLLSGAAREALLGRAAALYGPRLNALDDPASEDERLLRTALRKFMALTVEDASVRAELTQAAAAYIGLEGEPDPTALEPELFQTAFTVALQDRGMAFFERLLAAREEIDDPRFGGDSAKAMGAVRDPALVERAQQLALSGELGTRETWRLIEKLFSHPSRRDAIWRWYRDHFATIVDAIPEQWRRRTPQVGRQFCSRKKAEALQRFFATAGQRAPGYERKLERTVERIRLCAALKRERAGDLSRALTSYEATDG